MAYFITCIDKPNSLEKALICQGRVTLNYLTRFRSKLLTAGPLICKDGKPYGSLLILDFKIRSELDDFLKNDPYSLGGLFEEVIIKEFKKVF
jgi:uncharacterized protein YciI